MEQQNGRGERSAERSYRLPPATGAAMLAAGALRPVEADESSNKHDGDTLYGHGMVGTGTGLASWANSGSPSTCGSTWRPAWDSWDRRRPGICTGLEHSLRHHFNRSGEAAEGRDALYDGGRDYDGQQSRQCRTTRPDHRGDGGDTTAIAIQIGDYGSLAPVSW